MVDYADEPTLGEATFILKNEGNPTHPDFRVWYSIGPLYVCAHDDLVDHREWNITDARNHIVWQARYLDIFLSLGGLQTPQARDVGIHLIDAPAVREEEMNEEENEVEEEEEEADLEEDPNWQNEVVPMTPIPPAMTPKHHDPLPDQMVWDFNRDLDILDSGRVELEFDPVIWRDIYSMDEHPQEVNAVVPEQVVQEPLERIDEDEKLRMEAQDRVDRLWEEAGRELGLEVDDRNGIEGGENEDRGNQENGQELREEEEEQEPLARPLRRRRLTVRAYLRQFIRRDGSGPSNQGRLPSPTPDDSE